METTKSPEMQHIVVRRVGAIDFRQHPAIQECEPHWLLRDIYGRHLLKTKLRHMRPDLLVFMIRHQPEHEQLLESVVDVLDLRDWAEPRNLSERLKAVRQILRMAFDIDEEREPPNSRSV